MLGKEYVFNIRAETQHEVRCDVMVARMHRLEVITRTKYLYLDDPFQLLSVAAFDENGLFDSAR